MGSTVLMYHELSPVPSRSLYVLTESQFQQHLTLISGLRQSAAAGLGFSITFDDGHLSNFKYGFPALTKNSLEAIFFVITGRLSRRSDFMTWEQLRELVTAGNEVGSHGRSHRPLTHLCGPALFDELRDSKREIEDHLGVAVESLSLPHGRWNRRVLEACVKSGYTRVYTSNPWAQPFERAGTRIIGRWGMRQTVQAEDLKRWLEMTPLRARAGRARYTVKEMVKKAMGDRLYHAAWRTLTHAPLDFDDS